MTSVASVAAVPILSKASLDCLAPCSVLLQRDVRVVPVPDAERHATIAHGYAQLSALPRKLAVFGLYDDLVYPRNPGAVGKNVDNVSGNEDIFAEGGTPLQGPFLLILRLGLRSRRGVR